MPSRRFFVFELFSVVQRCHTIGSNGQHENRWDDKQKLHPDRVGMVPVERIELPTFGLQNRCSTAELNRRIEAIGAR